MTSVQASSLSRLIRMVGKPDGKSVELSQPFAIISAYERSQAPETNEAATVEMKERLEEEGLHVHTLVGNWQEMKDDKPMPVREEALFVLAGEKPWEEFKQVLLETARAFGQSSVLFSDGSEEIKKIYEDGMDGESWNSDEGDLQLSTIELAYRNLRGREEVPFVFAEAEEQVEKHLEIAGLLDEAADALDEGNQVCGVGVVLAKGLGRLLQLVGDPTQVPDDLAMGPEGFPEHVEPNPEKKVTKVQVSRPFAIMSGFRSKFTLRENFLRNAKLLRKIYGTKHGVHKLVGFWAEKSEDATDLPYEDAFQQEKVTQAKEESFFITMRRDEQYPDFEKLILSLVKDFEQDGALICDGEMVYLLESTGAKVKVGKDLYLNKLARAYSHMRGLPNVPFVFAGTQQPTSNMGNYAMAMRGLSWFENVEADDLKNAPIFAAFMGL